MRPSPFFTVCRFAETTRFFRLAPAGRRPAPFFPFPKGKTLYLTGATGGISMPERASCRAAGS